MNKEARMQKGTYVKNAAILTSTSLILRAAGMFFRIYIAAKIGAEGIGLFSLIMTVYALCVTYSTAGLSVVSTRIIAEQMAKNKDNIHAVVSKVIKLGVFLGVLCTILLIALAKPIGLYLLHDENAILPLQILAPSLPFMAYSAVLRGYFLAVKRVGPNARSQILEQILRIGVVVAILFYLQTDNLLLFVCAVVIGNTFSESISWVYMLYSYKKSVKKASETDTDKSVKSIAKILAPIAAAQYSTGTLKALENIMVPACLALFLGSRELAVEQFGALKGMALPVLFFPFSFISTLATLLLPDITSAHIQNQTAILQRLITRVLFMTLSVSVLAGGMYTVFANEIAVLLYDDISIAFYIFVLGPLTPFMYLESMVDGILKGMNEQVATFRYTMVDCSIRIVLIYILLPHFGMQGFLFIMLISNLLTCLLNLKRLLKVAKLNFSWRQWLIGPVIASVIAGVSWKLFFVPMVEMQSLLIQAIAGCIIFVCIYIVMLPIFSGVNFMSIIFKKT